MSSEIEQLKTTLTHFGLERQKPVGRLLGTRWQAHRNYIKSVVPEPVLMVAEQTAREHCPAILRLANAFQFNTADRSLAFDYSPDFDFTDEPMLAASFTVYQDGMHQFVPVSEDPLIWMHKWLWVADDYKGFNVIESIRRSVSLCHAIPVDEQRRLHRRTAWLERLNGF
jgi:hypothetical protein